MSHFLRISLAAIVVGAGLGLSQAAFAQPQPAPVAPVAPAAPVAPFAPVVGGDPRALDTKAQLQNVLRRYPPSVGQVLQLDPSLLSRPDYLAPYPALSAFLALHPDVVRNPQFYFDNYREGESAGGVTGVVRAIGNEAWVAIPLTLFLVVAWLIRQLVDYRRWLRASAAERELHNKVMDRMTNNADLLSYLESTAGRRLLEGMSVPGDSRAGQRVGAPINRILWSIQLGVIMAIVGSAAWLIGFAFNNEEAEQVGLVMGGMLAALGLGFIVSALISWALSVRLGLMGTPQSHS